MLCTAHVDTVKQLVQDHNSYHRIHKARSIAQMTLVRASGIVYDDIIRLMYELLYMICAGHICATLIESPTLYSGLI